MPFDQIGRGGPEGGPGGRIPPLLMVAAQEIFYRRKTGAIRHWLNDAVSEIQNLLHVTSDAVGYAFKNITPDMRAHYDGKTLVMGIPTFLHDAFSAQPHGEQPDPIINLIPSSRDMTLSKPITCAYTFPTATQLFIDEKRNFFISLLIVDQSNVLGHQIFEVDKLGPRQPGRLYVREVDWLSHG